MRRLLLLAGIAGLAWWWWSTREQASDERVVIGYEDGSSVDVPADGPAWGRALGLARDALAA
jgi:hypothetical protein